MAGSTSRSLPLRVAGLELTLVRPQPVRRFPGQHPAHNQRAGYLNILSAPYARNIHSFLGSSASASNLYISPAACAALMAYTGFPRTLLTAGGCEVLLDQIRVLRDRMWRDMGTEVEYLVMPDAVHDVLVFKRFKPERTMALDAIPLWLAASQAYLQVVT